MRILAVVVSLVCSNSALAQDTLIGAGIRSRPAYDGAASQRLDLIPVLRYYGHPWFARTTQGILEAGVRSALAPDFWAGAQLAYEHHFDAGVSAGLHLEWDRKLGSVPVTFLVRARQNVDGDRGGQADLRVTAGVLSWRGLVAGVFGQATWGSENAVRSMYGPPNSGLLFFSYGTLGSYELSRHWLVVGSLELRHLKDDASRSPLTERNPSYYASAALAYRFLQ